MNVNNISNAIVADRIVKTFGSRTVLNNLRLEIVKGESVAIVGANGSGKTTLLRCLAGLIKLNSGEIRWFGKPAAITPASRNILGMVSHDGFLYPHLTASENLVFAARMCSVHNPNQRADSLLRNAGMDAYAHRQARKLSRGMRQRLSILRALIHYPEIIILDEPFSALDTAGTVWLESILENLRRQSRTICFTTHDHQLAHTHSDRVLELRSGVLHIKENHEEQDRNTQTLSKAA